MVSNEEIKVKAKKLTQKLENGYFSRETLFQRESIENYSKRKEARDLKAIKNLDENSLVFNALNYKHDQNLEY